MALPSSPLPSPVCFVTWHQTDELMDFVNSNEPPSKIEHATLLHLSHLSLLFRKRSLLFLCSWILGVFSNDILYLRIFCRWNLALRVFGDSSEDILDFHKLDWSAPQTLDPAAWNRDKHGQTQHLWIISWENHGFSMDFPYVWWFQGIPQGIDCIFLLHQVYRVQASGNPSGAEGFLFSQRVTKAGGSRWFLVQWNAQLAMPQGALIMARKRKIWLTKRHRSESLTAPKTRDTRDSTDNLNGENHGKTHGKLHDFTSGSISRHTLMCIVYRAVQGVVPDVFLWVWFWRSSNMEPDLIQFKGHVHVLCGKRRSIEADGLAVYSAGAFGSWSVWRNNRNLWKAAVEASFLHFLWWKEKSGG